MNLDTRTSDVIRRLTARTEQDRVDWQRFHGEIGSQPPFQSIDRYTTTLPTPDGGGLKWEVASVDRAGAPNRVTANVFRLPPDDENGGSGGGRLFSMDAEDGAVGRQDDYDLLQTLTPPRGDPRLVGTTLSTRWKRVGGRLTPATVARPRGIDTDRDAASPADPNDKPTQMTASASINPTVRPVTDRILKSEGEANDASFVIFGPAAT